MAEKTYVIQCVRAADAILGMAGRERPHGIRSTLAGITSRGEVPEWKVQWAIEVSRLITQIEKPAARRALMLVMATDRCGPLYRMTEIATMMGVSISTLRRALDEAVEYLKDKLPDEKIAA